MAQGVQSLAPSALPHKSGAGRAVAEGTNKLQEFQQRTRAPVRKTLPLEGLQLTASPMPKGTTTSW